ncbi:MULTISPECIES: hypothetical protein [Methylobacterium]|uniref:hypothetical protein n=1 Tax=Methylobacterium TaxID=407 RepID=UPI0013EBD70B|nr:hypothetical protein [Methylobacterium sp. DB0501]NGM37947.1 hypothetical protein [Methylobacterium sp. DB0501]
MPFVPHADADAIIDAQRLMPGSGVGSSCKVTKFLRDSITTKVLRRWPEDA